MCHGEVVGATVAKNIKFMERTESEDSSSTLYKVMVNRKIVEKVQMNMNTNAAPSLIAHSGAACSNRAPADCDESHEIERLRKENHLLEQKYQDTFEALDKVRQTALEASERALSREFRIAFLEKALHGCEVSLNEAKDALHEHDKGMQKVKRETQKELGVLQSQVERLNAMVVEKDARILELINDLTRHRNTVNELTQRKSDLLKQLKDMCEKLNTVVWETNQREKLLNNVESELRKREMERQAAFLSEVTRSKRLMVGIKVKENMLNQIISTKNKKISELEKHVQKLLAKISRINGVFNDINFGMESPITLNTCENQCSQVECNLASPCNVQVLSGRAKVLL